MILKQIKQYLNRFTDRRPILQCNVATMDSNHLLKGRIALITGGTSGIGYSIAESFLKSGAKVIITGRKEIRLSQSCEKLSNLGDIRGYVLDNTNVSSFQSVFNRMITEIGNIDILVNNAGVNFKGIPNAVENEYDLVMETNLKGPFFLSQLFGKYLIENKIQGNILNIASASSLRPADSAYILSKWGLRGLTLGLAKSLAPYGITVNGIAPGPTATPMLRKSENTDMSLSRIPLGRFIQPEEIANMAVFLVSDMGRSIIGDIVYMTGGAGLLTYDDVPYTFN